MNAHETRELFINIALNQLSWITHMGDHEQRILNINFDIYLFFLSWINESLIEGCFYKTNLYISFGIMVVICTIKSNRLVSCSDSLFSILGYQPTEVPLFPTTGCINCCTDINHRIERCTHSVISTSNIIIIIIINIELNWKATCSTFPKYSV